MQQRKTLNNNDFFSTKNQTQQIGGFTNNTLLEIPTHKKEQKTDGTNWRECVIET